MTEPKRFKRDVISLEQLPNELFIEVFAYLNSVDTVYAFSQLNNRFQSLLIHYVHTFDFKSIHKAKFDYIIQHHDIHQWRSLRLSEDDATPGQIRLFCQLYPPHQYISQLQSLCALNMTPKYASEFISQLVSFDHLVSLELGNICGKNIEPFELPLLKRLIVTGCKHTRWMMNFYSLQSLEYTVEHSCCHDYVLTFPTTLKQLKLLYVETIDGDYVRGSLRQLSQLTKLALYDNGSYNPFPNGEAWETLIQSSLPLLKIFQFCFCFCSNRFTPNDISLAVASFSTPFYLVEKRWYIRCNYDCKYAARGALYSLPFAFAEMPVNITTFDAGTSTLVANDMDGTKYESYEKVQTLLFNESCQMLHRGFAASNIVRLVLKTTLPTSWHFLLSNLRHVEFKRRLVMSSIDFNEFLSNTPQLQSMVVPIRILSELTDKFTNNTVCEQLSERIKSLTISPIYSSTDQLDHVTVHVLPLLARIFGKTCEHLSLGLAAHPNTILPVLRRMRQLRSLHVYCHRWSRISKDTAIRWMEEIRKTANASDFLHAPDDRNFYIWFGNRP